MSDDSDDERGAPAADEAKGPIVSLSAAERLARVREALRAEQLAALVVPSEDAHQSEYVADADKRREWLSGFDGSAGLAVVTADAALLWTDGRYFNQAQQQLSAEWTLMKQGLPDTPSYEQWLAKKLPAGSRVGVDPLLTPLGRFRALSSALAAAGSSVVSLKRNLVDAAWDATHTRPRAPGQPVVVHEERFAGQSVASKLAAVRAEMAAANCDTLVVCALDEVAWLFNLRGSDVQYSPVFMSYALVTDSAATLFVEERQLTPPAAAALKAAGVAVKPYGAVFAELTARGGGGGGGGKGARVWMDPVKSNQALYEAVPNPAARVLERDSPVALLKAVKNATELEGMRQCHVRDAVALVRFLSWLESRSDSQLGALTEFAAAERLELFRSRQELFAGLSFDTIAASGPNGAVIHYKPNSSRSRPLSRSELFLLDSGGQYRDGTTDVTRTVHLGAPSPHQVHCFTRVLQGHIALARAIFPAGTCGPQLDVLARAALWSEGLDYRHGTGHGVGAFLCVHEGPHGISSSTRKSTVSETPLRAGMVVTNEPGYYEDGAFGIRIENVMAVVDAATRFRFGGVSYFKFETLTLVPIQKKMVDPNLLRAEELRWLNDYHATVLEKLAPHLQDAPEELAWLREATSPLLR